MAVPIETPPSPHAERVLRSLEAERKRDEEERITGWTVVWTLFAFKMATVGVIWFAANGSHEANVYIAATTWYWAAIPAISLSGLIAFRWRLRKARKQADRLRQREFAPLGDEHEPVRFTDEELRNLIALDRRRARGDRPGEG